MEFSSPRKNIFPPPPKGVGEGVGELEGISVSIGNEVVAR